MNGTGTMTHTVFGGLAQFSDKILQLYYKLVGEKIPNTPLVIILTMLPDSYIQDKKGLLCHFLAAARSLISRNWRKVGTLSLMEWACNMDSLSYLEQIFSWETGKSKVYRITWTV